MVTCAESKPCAAIIAPAEQKTEVEFTFSSGEQIYQVLRAPEQELKKQRGEGTRKVPAAAALFKLLADGSKEPLAAKSDEVTKKVTELIGFKAEQFRQIVLLPQGEFRRFLIAESKDRKAILETIFKTELYRRIETLLADRSSAIDSDYKLLKQQRQFILDSSHCEDQAQLSGKLQELQQQQASIAAALLAAASQVEQPSSNDSRHKKCTTPSRKQQRHKLLYSLCWNSGQPLLLLKMKLPRQKKPLF